MNLFKNELTKQIILYLITSFWTTGYQMVLLGLPVLGIFGISGIFNIYFYLIHFVLVPDFLSDSDLMMGT